MVTVSLSFSDSQFALLSARAAREGATVEQLLVGIIERFVDSLDAVGAVLALIAQLKADALKLSKSERQEVARAIFAAAYDIWASVDVDASSPLCSLAAEAVPAEVGVACREDVSE